ncbi:hypothetical protein BD779DRAFT_1515871, partial [Infundibulicybe gibba]
IPATSMVKMVIAATVYFFFVQNVGFSSATLLRLAVKGSESWSREDNPAPCSGSWKRTLWPMLYTTPSGFLILVYNCVNVRGGWRYRCGVIMLGKVEFFELTALLLARIV